MTMLHLGVVDMPYSNAPGATTGDVAGYLENKYHIVEVFWELAISNGAPLLRHFENALSGELESIMMGKPPGANPFAGGEDAIKVAFSKFLESRQMEALGIPGVPTRAAMEGVSHRFKNRRNPRGRRPSFVDTGLYESSFRAWFT